ncbi:MAG: formate/nitrite transporter family protein [Usitatibacter sp.]
MTARKAPKAPGEPHLAKAQREAEEVHERSAPITPVIYEVVRKFGEEEMSRPSISLWWSGVAAGLSISFSLLAQAVLQARTPETTWQPLIVALGFPVGFLMVVLGRQQLFTENTITMVLPVMDKPSRRNFGRLARVWSIVLAANLAGTLTAAIFCTYTPVLSPEVRDSMLAISHHAMDHGWWEMLFLAVTAGFLMAAMVWLIPGAEGAHFHVVAMMTYLIAISGSAHIVTGSMEAFLLLINGQVEPLAMLWGFAVPVLAGNIIGGTVLFATISYAQVMKET